MGRVSRRAFVRQAACAAGAVLAVPSAARAAVAAPQRRRRFLEQFSDLRRHFLFVYYPWYRTDPWEHWDEGGRKPPAEIASNYMPALGLYDSRSRDVIEQHARWIADSGAGGIDVSWWGRDSNVNEVIPTLMDVMHAHDLHVSFFVEPYAVDHARNYASDVLYLVKNYGDRRHWDCFLLHEYADGKVGPVFKSFRTILPETTTDCHGAKQAVSDYAADDVWRRQLDTVRETLSGDFDRVTLLADSLDVVRAQDSGFDGTALFDNYVGPERWREHVENCTARNLVFSLQVNPGFDGIVVPQTDPNACYAPPTFSPGGGAYDWSRTADREAAAAASRARIVESFDTSLDLQTAPVYMNVKDGFFLVYINSFNEWHEGHQFEPAKDRAALSDRERALGYHNPENGGYRLDALRDLIRGVVDP